MESIQTFRFRIERDSVQAGLTNEEFGERQYTEYRWVHWYATMMFVKATGMKEAKKDAKFHDLVCPVSGRNAEGKRLSIKDGVSFTPSRDSGTGRGVKQDNIQKCFENNAWYYLYTTTALDETHWELTTWLVPIAMIKSWYGVSGTAGGKINYKKCMKHITESPQTPVVDYNFSRESGFRKL